MTILFVLIGISFAVIFSVVAYIIAKKQADHGKIGTMDKWSADVMPLCVMIDASIESFEIKDAMLYAEKFYLENLSLYAIGVCDRVQSGRKTITVTISDEPMESYAQANVIYDETTGEIKHAAIFVDESDIPNHSQQEMREIMAHEWGHVLGLAHDVDPESIMYGAIPKDREKAILTKHDIDLLRKTYR